MPSTATAGASARTHPESRYRPPATSCRPRWRQTTSASRPLTVKRPLAAPAYATRASRPALLAPEGNQSVGWVAPDSKLPLSSKLTP